MGRSYHQPESLDAALAVLAEHPGSDVVAGGTDLVVGDRQGKRPLGETLVAIHADPMMQAPHCLRAPGDDGEAGTAAALAACRTAIEEELAAALEGAPRETVRVWLAFGGVCLLFGTFKVVSGLL